MKKPALMIIALFIASLNLRPAINSVSPLLDNISKDLGMSAAIASLLTSIPVLCMGVFSPVAIKVSGKWGIERIIGWSLFIIGVGTVIRLFTYSGALLLATALIAGIGIAMIGPLLAGFIKQHFPKYVPSMIAVYTVALTLGAAASSYLSVPLQKSLNTWQRSLGIWAILAFIATFVWWLFVNLQIKKTAHTGLPGATVKLPWKNGKAWLLTLSFGLMSMLFYSLTAWIPQIIQEMGYTKAYATTSFTFFIASQIPVTLLFPLLLKKLPSRRFWLIAGSLLELGGLILLAEDVVPWAASMIIGIGAGGLFPLNLILPIDVAGSAHEAASWSAMTQSAGYVISSMGPILIGWIRDISNSFTSAVFGMIVITLLMIIIQLAATTKRQNEGQLEAL